MSIALKTLFALTALWAHAEARGALQEVSRPANGNSSICDDVQQYSGYYKLTTGGVFTKNYFYWFFESRGSPATDPVVLWMTGGPGCSSEVALFGENGPCSVNAGGNDTITNPYSWNTNANILYIDQPTGTGFSYGTGLDSNEVEVSKDMYDFLQQFFKGHTKYASLPFFAFGESYAGHYIPAVTHRIWLNNNNLPQGALKINLQGTSVGNGLTDPEIQYNYYPEMAISTNGHKAAVSTAVYDAMKAAVGPCVKLITACQTNMSACILAIDLCNIGELIPYTATGMNPYDMRVKCAVPPLCYDFSNVGVYLDRPDVRAALGVGNQKWSDCNRAVTLPFELGGDWMHDYQDQIPDQLAAGIRVLMYAGDQDYICNWLGNQAWTKALEWPHKSDFNNVALKNISGVGSLRSSNGFSFLQVYDAGHMVPRDQPKAALQMLTMFLNGDI